MMRRCPSRQVIDNGKHGPFDLAESDDAALAIVAPRIILLDDIFREDAARELEVEPAFRQVAKTLLLIPLEHPSPHYTLDTYDVQRFA